MRVRGVDKDKNKYLIVNKPVDDEDQALESALEGRRCIEPRVYMNL